MREIMNPIIRDAGVFVLRELNLLSSYELRRKGWLRDVGWFESFRTGAPVDAGGRPVPWLTYPAIAFLEGRVHPHFKVFEFGAGNSTMWWSERVTEVVSCEHDPEWYEQIRSRSPKNSRIELRSLKDGSYVSFIDEFPARFDVVVIDGRERNECARRCLPALNASGVILWDNTDRARYAEGLAFLAEMGFRRIDFPGLTPGSIENAQTSILYRSDNCLGI